MTIRVCFLGNSHVIAPKRAWDANPRPGFHTTFISAPGDDMKKLAVDDRVLRMSAPEDRMNMEVTSNGLNHVAVDDYDAFVLCGLTLRSLWATGIYMTHRLARHAGPEHQLLSRGALEAAITETLTRKSSFMTLANIRKLTDKPVIAVPEPLPTAKVLDSKYGAPWGQLFTAELLKIFDDVTDALYARHDAAVVRQPLDTIENEVFTQGHFANGAIRMWKGHKFDDSNFLHMNDEYGRRILDVVFARLEDARQPSSAVAV